MRNLLNVLSTFQPNATYLSPDIQNKTIDVLSDTVTHSIVTDDRNADVPWFSILEDGTHDENNRENNSIEFRYVINGNPKKE